MHLSRYCSTRLLGRVSVLAACVLMFGVRSAVADPITVASDASPLPVAVSAYDAHLRYDGRFDKSDPAGPKCAWPACTVRIEFKATAVNIKLGEKGTGDEYEVVVDGVPSEILVPPDGAHVYAIYAGDARRVHAVDVIKRTEVNYGAEQVLGFELASGGRLVQTPAFTKRIEIIGDSISAGYGSEGKNEKEKAIPSNENAYITYGADAAIAFGAGLTDLGWSGIRMWPSWAMPDVYDLAVPTDWNLKWDFSRLVPDAVLINLGTNDWNGSAPDEKGWTAAYEAFVHRVRSHYPNALIYCATSPLMNGDALDQEHRYLQEIVDFENRSGDTKVKLLVLPVQDAKNGIGAEWHPNATTHRIMGDTLIEALKHDLGWKTLKNAR